MAILLTIVFLLFCLFCRFILAADRRHRLRLIKDKFDPLELSIIQLERRLCGVDFSTTDIQSFSANYLGGYTKFPQSFSAFVFLINGAIYIQHSTNDKIIFRIHVSDIVNFGIYTPSAPYVMNLNASAVMANEMTRRQIGKGVYISFINDLDMQQDIQLESFDKGDAGMLVQLLHADFEEHKNVVDELEE